MLKTTLIVVGLSLGGIAVSASHPVAESSSAPQRGPQNPRSEKGYQGWVTNTRRQCARLFFFYKTGNKNEPWGGSPGEVAIEYGLADWKPGYMESFKKMKHRYWRLGRDHWTNLDLRAAVDIGGIPVEAGYYYLAVHMDTQGKWYLELLDPDRMSAQGIDAWHLNRRKVPAGIRVPLEGQVVKDVARVLQIKLHLIDKAVDRRKALLEIRFGPHRLTTKLFVKI